MPQQAYDMTKEYYDQWFDRHIVAEDLPVLLRQQAVPRRAYNLQQACERPYYCVLLVYTFYTPYSHNIKFLRQLAERISLRLVEAWPRRPGNRKCTSASSRTPM
jgi:hypothetical protein